MFELHDRAAAWSRREGQLDFREEIRIERPLAVELPAEQQALRRLPGQHLSPLRLGAFGIALEPPPTGARLEEDGDMRILADGLSFGPPVGDAAGENLEGAYGRSFHLHGVNDGREAHSGV